MTHQRNKQTQILIKHSVRQAGLPYQPAAPVSFSTFTTHLQAARSVFKYFFYHRQIMGNVSSQVTISEITKLLEERVEDPEESNSTRYHSLSILLSFYFQPLFSPTHDFTCNFSTRKLEKPCANIIYSNAHVKITHLCKRRQMHRRIISSANGKGTSMKDKYVPSSTL